MRLLNRRDPRKKTFYGATGKRHGGLNNMLKRGGGPGVDLSTNLVKDKIAEGNERGALKKRFLPPSSGCDEKSNPYRSSMLRYVTSKRQGNLRRPGRKHKPEGR